MATISGSGSTIVTVSYFTSPQTMQSHLSLTLLKYTLQLSLAAN